MRSIILTLLLAFLFHEAYATQHGLINGGMEGWRRGQFRCCGRNVDLPVGWGIPEQSCGINFNKFVFIEENPFYVHNGRYCALLSSDTTFFNGVGLQPGMLVYGGYQDLSDSLIRLGQPVPKYGLPIDSNPVQLDFWLMMSHDLSDTFSYMYLFTRWDSVRHEEDTLAFTTVDVPDTHVVSDQWFEIKDSIDYRHAGQADTVKIIFYGGRFGNPALQGNATWIDDIRLIYAGEDTATTTGIATPAETPWLLYPNPATDMLHILLGNASASAQFDLYDESGRIVLEKNLTVTSQNINISGVASGVYVGRIIDGSGLLLYQQKVIVVR